MGRLRSPCHLLEKLRFQRGVSFSFPPAQAVIVFHGVGIFQTLLLCFLKHLPHLLTCSSAPLISILYCCCWALFRRGNSTYGTDALIYLVLLTVLQQDFVAIESAPTFTRTPTPTQLPPGYFSPSLAFCPAVQGQMSSRKQEEGDKTSSLSMAQ